MGERSPWVNGGCETGLRPAMKIRLRDGRSTPHLSSRSSPNTLLDAPDGDDGVSVNKAGYSPYAYDVAPAVVKAALKVECSSQAALRTIDQV